MKHKNLFILFFSCILTHYTVLGQDNRPTLPAVKIKTLEGKEILASMLQNDEGGPIMINFWATWCKPCILELSTIQEQYADWVAETKVKLIAISIDDARSKTRVATFANGKAWEFEIYLDENSDLKRALNVNNIPHTFILNPKGEIVYQHVAYNPGDEEEYLQVLRKLASQSKER